jgi:hypothetical protein
MSRALRAITDTNLILRCKDSVRPILFFFLAPWPRAAQTLPPSTGDEVMSNIKQVLLDGRISDVIDDQTGNHGFPLLCFKECDSIGFALRKLASEALMSALVLKSTVLSDSSTDDTCRLFSTVYVRDILGFVDLNNVMQNLVRGASCLPSMRP